MIETFDEPIDKTGWSFVEPRMFNRQLARALKLPHIQEAFHDACTVAAAGKRWDALRFHNYSLIPAPFEPRTGELLRPIDIETSDWRWSQPAGRPPAWHYYVTSHLCHWLCYPNLLLAEHLFPQVKWRIVSNEKHSTVVSFESKLIFDLYYSAAGVPIESCTELLFGGGRDGLDFDVYLGYQYSYREGLSGLAEELFKRLDAAKGEAQEILKGMREVLQRAEAEDVPYEGLAAA